MKIHPQGREWYRPGPSTTPPVDAEDWAASFDGGTAWVAATLVDDEPAWLVRGPLYDPDTGDGTASVALPAGRTKPLLRVIDNPEVIVTGAPAIDVKA